MTSTISMDAVQALETVAIAGAITAVRLGNRENLAFWRGQFNAAKSLKNGALTVYAERIARSGYPVQREVEGAFACLANDPKGLSGARVHEVLMTYGIEVADHDIAKSQLELRGAPKHGGEAVIGNAHHEQAASSVDGNDGSGVHAGSPEIDRAIVAQGGAA